jgi:hypothetical protein
MVEDLINQFKQVKNYTPTNQNELVTFLKKLYIHDELSIVNYKKIYSELNQLKAEKI